MPIPHQEVIYSAAGRPNTLTRMQMCKRERTHTHKHSAVNPIRPAGQDNHQTKSHHWLLAFPLCTKYFSQINL